MAKLPLITVVAPDSGPAKIAAVPKTGGGDSKAYFDSDTGKVVVNELVIDSQSVGILKTDVNGNVTANASIGHAEVDGLGDLALLNSVNLDSAEVTGVLQVANGGTGKSSVTAGSLLLGAGTGDMTELAGTSTGQVVKWNNSTQTWYAGTESGGGGGGGAVDSVTGTSPITVDNADPANPVVEIDQTSISITASQVSGLATVATSGSASDITTGTLGKAYQAAQDVGGDLSGSTTSATVTKIQGNAFSSAAPSNGQIPVWSSSANQWVPGASAQGGSGGGGVLYYMNAGTSRSNNGLPVGTYQLGRTAEVGNNPITISNVATGGWTRVAGFVSDASDPDLASIAAGIWDFNVWATSTANANTMYFRLVFYAYDGSTNPESGTAIASTTSTYLYDPSVNTQYITSFNIPATSFSGKRVYIKLEAQATAASKDATFNFGDSNASHVHTTIPSVSGTGLMKVVDGVVQTPASTLVDADVASNAAIARNKLAVSDAGDKGKLLMNDASSGAIVAATYASLAQGGLGTGSNTAGSAKLLIGNGTAFAEQTMSGDATIDASGSLTLANSGVTAATKGGATKSAIVQVDSKGRVTSLTEADILLTSAGLPAEVVYTNTAQTISGNKTFSGELTFSNGGLTASRVLKLDANSKVASDYVRNADIASDAAIARDKLAAGSAFNSLVVNNGTDKKLTELAISATAGHILKSDGSAATWGQLDLSNSNSVTGTLSAGNVGDLSGTYLTNTLAASTYAPIASPTFTGKTTTAASVSGEAGFNIPAGTAPSSPVNGDIWTTTAGVFAQINGSTKQLADTGYSGVPYDISGEAVGAVSLNDVVGRFFASRDCTIKSGSYTGARCATAPSGGNAVFNINKNGSNAGTITFTNGSSTGIVSISIDISLTGGTDYLTVECSSAFGIYTPWFTLKGIV